MIAFPEYERIQTARRPDCLDPSLENLQSFLPKASHREVMDMGNEFYARGVGGLVISVIGGGVC